MATLTNVTSRKSVPASWSGTRNTTSSPASADGRTPCASPAGPTTTRSGLVPVRANPIARQAGSKARAIPATSGRSGRGSLDSAALTWSLANRLRKRLGMAGSIWFAQTWKRKATPLGRAYWAHTASGRRILGKGCTSWPTPDAALMNVAADPVKHQARRDRLKAKWNNGNGTGLPLGQAVHLATWPTATLHDAGRGGQAKRAIGKTRHGSNLQDFVMLASWPSPMAGSKGTSEYNEAGDNGRQVWLSTSPAQMASRGQLNPAFSLWLMGYPTAWARCAARVTRSSRSSPPHSSRRT